MYIAEENTCHKIVFGSNKEEEEKNAPGSEHTHA